MLNLIAYNLVDIPSVNTMLDEIATTSARLGSDVLPLLIMAVSIFFLMILMTQIIGTFIGRKIREHDKGY